MNWLDLSLLALAVIAAVGGWRLGFVRRFSGWVGAGAGLATAIVLAPWLVRRVGLASDLTVLLMVLALLVLLASIGQALGAVIGSRIHREVDSPVVRSLDAVAGTVLGVVGVALLAWLVLPVMTRVDGWPSSAVAGSWVAEAMAGRLPEPPSQIRELEEELFDGGYPQLFADLRGAPDIPPPPVGSPVGQTTLDLAARSAVRLQSEACNRLQSGSGFFVGRRLVVTNAHVVAGSGVIQLTTADGARGTGEVVAFDPVVDLALVRTALDRPAVRLAPPAEGDRGLVLGFPGGGPFDPSPFEVGRVLRARGYDIYDSTTVDRDLLALAAQLQPGDSGSAVLRADGAVIGVAVAVAPDETQVAYALADSELEGLLATPVGGPVATGRCTS